MNKARETQIKRYGGEAGYRAEMARRRSLVKTFYLKDNKGAAKALAAKRWQQNKDEDRPGGQVI